MAFIDTFGDRMKAYEAVETVRRLDPRTSPVYARLDGRGFSKFTRGLRRPFDPRMMAAMHETTRHLVGMTNAAIGYTQSDEISLVWSIPDDANELAQMFFDGKLQKLVSVLASSATAAFTRAILASGDAEFMAYADRLPHFDARVFALPDREEAANAFLWRCNDAERNAISMVAQHLFPHKALKGVNQAGMLRMTAEAGVDFEEFPQAFRFGQFFQRSFVARALTIEERDRRIAISEKPVDTIFYRAEIMPLLGMGSFRKVVNRADVIFNQDAPKYAD